MSAHPIPATLLLPDTAITGRVAARETIIRNFDLATVCLPKWLDLLGRPV